MLIIFDYAAHFNVGSIQNAIVGPEADLVAVVRTGFAGDCFYWFPINCLPFLSAW